VNDKPKLQLIFIESIKFIANIHNKYMFHGDIKPANIFFKDNFVEMKISSDLGSLV